MSTRRRDDPTSLEMVRAFWNAEACGERDGELQEITRYRKEPEILDFANFASARGIDVLEVGVGMGADFVRWVQAGARAVGVDLTERAIGITSERLRARSAIRTPCLAVADCERLPLASESFDLVYSWGVLHHTTDTAQAMREAMRVLRPGGRLKVMLYHRYSWFALAAWIRFGVLRGRPFITLSKAVSRVESPGTKAFLPREVIPLLPACVDVNVRPQLTYWDRRFFPIISNLFGDRFGWHLLVEATKT